LRSTLTTSAPRSARICPAQGPARIRASSRTRRPASGGGMEELLGFRAGGTRRSLGEGGPTRPSVGQFLGSGCLACRINLVHRLGTRPPCRCRIFMRLISNAVARQGIPVNGSFFGELLQSISERGRSLIDRARDRRGSDE